MSHPSLSTMCASGYWFCERCDRCVAIAGDPESPARCPRCKHATAVWQVPVFPAAQPGASPGDEREREREGGAKE